MANFLRRNEISSARGKRMILELEEAGAQIIF